MCAFAFGHFPQASISVAVIFLSYVGHVHTLPFMRMQTVMATTESGASKAVAVLADDEPVMTNSPLALQRLAKRKAEEAAMSSAGAALQRRRSLAVLEQAVDAFAPRRSRRRSTVAVVQEKAKLALVSIDYNSFESAFLISSVRMCVCLCVCDTAWAPDWRQRPCGHSAWVVGPWF